MSDLQSPKLGKGNTDEEGFANNTSDLRETLTNLDEERGGSSSESSVVSYDEKLYTLDENGEIEVKIEKGEAIDFKSISTFRKWVIVMIISLTSFDITFLSSCWSMIEGKIMEEFHVGHEVATLGISLYIWALGVGPMFLGPISEYHGRKTVYIFSTFLSFSFQLLTAFSKNLGGMLFGRLISAFFGSAFMSVASGTISDVFEMDHLGLPMAIYSVTPFLAPSLGPLVSGFVADSNADYRWVFYSGLIFTGVLMAAIVLLIPETYVPVLLIRKAKALREKTGDSRFYAPQEKNPLTLFQSVILSSKRPMLLILRDPMVLTLDIYSGLILAIVYLFFVSFPYTFKTVWGFGLSAQGLSFLGLLTGMLLSLGFQPIFTKLYHKAIANNNNIAKPEFRFPILMFGGLILPISLFIMSWVCYPNLHWIGMIIVSAVYGIGTCLAFAGIFTYTVQAYKLYAASAIASNSFVRSFMAGAFPLFGLQMYEALGVHWATMVIAFAALALAPVPFLFYKYGEKLRARSPYAWSD
ncbi:unnamed protein product [[Candida] boidinii]|uniref:Unnamed protein product n=1 Tax=Candida boidinii TaxID=5477 RepID=A0ACB5TLN6_CANBO|nr:unnamed protein product [[Candida] boidinii]